MEDRAKNQTRTVLLADKITGPYRIVASGIKPLGMNAGDFDLVTSPDDGKGYMYFDRIHTEVICADLTYDYTSLACYCWLPIHFEEDRPVIEWRAEWSLDEYT